MYFLKNLLLYSGAWFKQTKCIVMMTKDGSIKILNFMAPRAGDSCARVWLYKLYIENALFLKKSFSLLPGIDHTNLAHVYSNDHDQGRDYQNSKFYDHRAGVPARAWSYKLYSENALFL